jgi:hypothetical protein
MLLKVFLKLKKPKNLSLLGKDIKKTKKTQKPKKKQKTQKNTGLVFSNPAFSGSRMCSIMSARNLKSSKWHSEYIESSSVLKKERLVNENKT